MTDPFEYIRTQLGPIDEDNANLCEGCVRDLLDDANALLAVVPFGRHKKECQIARAWGLGPGGTFTDPHCNCGFENALAVLPKHLREDQ